MRHHRSMDSEETDTGGHDGRQAEHERLKKNPNILMLGEGPGEVNFSKPFAHKLTDLTPTQRRLALAKACAQPWRDDPDAMPDCYRLDLDQAVYEAREEHLGCCTTVFDPDYLFETEPEPISPYLLRQLAEMTPGHRRSSLVFVISGCWRGHLSEELRALALANGIELGDPEDFPEWVIREHMHRGWDYAEEREAYRPPVADTGEGSTPQHGANAVEGELNPRIDD